MDGSDPENTDASGWLEVRVDADAESVEAVAELFGRYGYNHGVVIQEPFVQDDDGDHITIDPARPVAVSTYLPVNEHLGAVLRRIEEGVWHLRQIGQVGELQTLDRPEAEWADAWKKYFRVTRIGRRFVVRPRWLDYEPRADDVVISLDPGLAFGTGLHPTTDLCLRTMEDLDLAGHQVLDAGAGSGILSIAAAKLGAARVDAVEIDQVAIPALRSNIALNELAERIRVIPGDVGSVIPSGARYDLVVANIISRILISAAAPLSAATRVGGYLLLSGVIETHEADVVAAFSEVGLDIRARRTAGDWIALLLVRR
jgi:ribosomal protein L11 methyltransferase